MLKFYWVVQAYTGLLRLPTPTFFNVFLYLCFFSINVLCAKNKTVPLYLNEDVTFAYVLASAY